MLLGLAGSLMASTGGSLAPSPRYVVCTKYIGLVTYQICVWERHSLNKERACGCVQCPHTSTLLGELLFYTYAEESIRRYFERVVYCHVKAVSVALHAGQFRSVEF